MKIHHLFLFLTFSLLLAANIQAQCTYNDKKLYVGEKGGCYYLTAGGEKEYVDRKYCRDCEKAAKKKTQPKEKETDDRRRQEKTNRRETPKNRRAGQ
jgi:hypothetical protein